MCFATINNLKRIMVDTKTSRQRAQVPVLRHVSSIAYLGGDDPPHRFRARPKWLSTSMMMMMMLSSLAGDLTQLEQ